MITVQWHLAKLVRPRFTATELTRRLALVGTPLSLSEVTRLLAGTPMRPSLPVLGGLCEVVECTLNDMITFERPIAGRGPGLPPEAHLR